LQAIDEKTSLETVLARCDGGDAGACSAAALAFALGERGAKKDEARSVSFATRACQLGSWESCGSLAVALKTGIGVPKDIPRALKMALSACNDGGEAPSCVTASELLVEHPKELGHHEAQAFGLALRGRSEFDVVTALSAWLAGCGSDASKLDYRRIGRAVTECAHLLDENAARLRTMELDPGIARENVDEELKSVCGEFRDAIPERPATSFEWPKTCSNLGIDAPPPPPPAEPQPTGPADWNPGH
jgi:hypothetical protein